METEPDATKGLNTHQRSHLRACCQHADKLLGDIEAILVATESKTIFPKYEPDLTPAQIRVVRDYIARLREQTLRVLQSLDIHPPAAPFSSLHAIRVTLAFVQIAFDEIAPRYLRGYGAVPDELVPELDGLSGELVGLVERMHLFLAEGGEADLQARIEQLPSAIALSDRVKRLSADIQTHGLVELRPSLLSIVDRMSEPNFEIAVFGQVSTGKSSLLNHILGTDILPVGVNPITSVPTRIRFGSQPQLMVSYADRRVEQFPVSQLADFATEQGNPANSKRLVRLELEYPSPRLQTGIVLVDTPGLGSLATAGSKETMAYLPKCDYGVALINASSTVGPDDIRTLLSLRMAGIPAQVLLSKADLLTPSERDSAIRYTRQKLHDELDWDLNVACVSVLGSNEALFEDWFENSLSPLLAQHKELAAVSIANKVVSLELAVAASLKARAQQNLATSPETVQAMQAAELHLRRAAGGFPEAESAYLRACDQLRITREPAVDSAARRVAGHWSATGQPAPGSLVAGAIYEAVNASMEQMKSEFARLVAELTAALNGAAKALDPLQSSGDMELGSLVREMPQFQISLPGPMSRPWLGFFGGPVARWVARKMINERLGSELQGALDDYARVIESWSRRTLRELQLKFDGQADPYRVQLGRATTIPTLRRAG